MNRLNDIYWADYWFYTKSTSYEDAEFLGLLNDVSFDKAIENEIIRRK